MKENNQEELKVISAWLHYIERMTHEEIAEQLHLSRVSVTRLIQKAREEGIVQFTITKPLPAQYQLENRLKDKFNLRSVVIVKTMAESNDTLTEVSRAGARALTNLLFPGCRVGVAFSSTLRSLVDYLTIDPANEPITIQELSGTYLSPTTPYGVSWQLAEKLKARLISLPVPAIVQSEEAHDAILSEPSIREAMQGIGQVDLAIVGLGQTGANATLLKTSYLNEEQMQSIRDQGGVGDILFHFYDINGNYVHTPLEGRVIALTWENVTRIPDIIAVAYGIEKVKTILGALRTGVVHHLVTDYETARAVLEA